MADAFDAKEFRQTLGTFTTGVTIITAVDPSGTPVGVTANSFNSVSLDPPMVLWSLARSSRSLAAFESSSHWAVHILSADQEALSNRFARSSPDKFSGIEVDEGTAGVPLLRGCAARLECKTSFRYEGGDHIIFVGEVVAFERAEMAPLVFHAGRYAVATRKTDSSIATGPAVADDRTSFGEDFLGYLVTRAHFQTYARLRARIRQDHLSDPEWFVLSSLTAKNGRSVAELNDMYAITGGAITTETIQPLIARSLLKANTEASSQLLHLTEQGLGLTIRVLAAEKATEADLEAKLGHHDTVALKNLLRQLIQLTDPGLPDMWGRTI